jgi:hypothetical protein
MERAFPALIFLGQVGKVASVSLRWGFVILVVKKCLVRFFYSDGLCHVSQNHIQQNSNSKEV